jgi:hypothetical protein
MVGAVALVEGSVDAEVRSGVAIQSVNTGVVDIVNIHVQGREDGTFTEVFLAFLFGQHVDSGDIGIDLVDEIVNGGFGRRQADF